MDKIRKEIDQQISLLHNYLKNEELIDELLKESLMFGITHGVKSTALLYEYSSFAQKNNHYPTDEQKEQIKESVRKRIALGVY